MAKDTSNFVNNPPQVLVLGASPRRDGNSSRLSKAFAEGAIDAGYSAEIIYLPEHIKEFLRDCRTCRNNKSQCTITDGYRDLFVNKVLPADALVFATPIWWYGISGILKTFLDRMFCYVALSEPNAQAYAAQLQNKRVALLLSAEESNFSARLGIVHQIQEMSRYLNHSFVGVVTGLGNRGGDADKDPAGPIAEARKMGNRLFDIEVTDYKLDTPRAGSVWADDAEILSYWR